MRQLGMLFVALFATTTTWADFGEYRGHELNDDTLVVTSTLGELRITAVDDAALDVGRVRFRSQGSPGGHNGLRSVSQALGSDEYPRLRIGVGGPPGGEDLSDWVLSPMSLEDEDVILGLLPELVRGVEVWGNEGMETAMNEFNR